MAEIVIVFLKYPEKGKVKTRLAKAIGNDNALKVYKYLVSNTLQNLIGLNAIQLHFNGLLPKHHEFNAFNIEFQKGKNIGERMFNSLHTTLKKADKAILMGSDIPDITSKIISDGFKALDNSDLVFGPTTDGGYYLVGMKSPIKEIFQLNYWSHENVLNDTLQIADSLGYTYKLLNQLTDIDTVEDLMGHADLKNKIGL